MYGHTKKALDEKIKPLNIKGEPKHTSNLDTIINAIHTHTTNVIKRMEYYTQQKMNILFDAAKDTHMQEYFCNSTPS